MKDYETPELVELGEVIELTLGTRPGDLYDQSGAEYWPSPGCGCDDGGGGPPFEN